MDEVDEKPPVGRHFRICVPSGTCVQIYRNSGEYKRSPPWHPAYGILVFIHGNGRESVAQRLVSAPGLLYLETKAMMDDYRPPVR